MDKCRQINYSDDNWRLQPSFTMHLPQIVRNRSRLSRGVSEPSTHDPQLPSPFPDADNRVVTHICGNKHWSESEIPQMHLGCLFHATRFLLRLLFWTCTATNKA